MTPITILVCALGGEGGGVLAEWLVETAIAAGHDVQSTSIPGVAQRTGATTYYIEVFPRPRSELAGRRPVFSLTPVPGAIDLLVSSELLETARQIGNGMSHADRTMVVSSVVRTLTTAEKMQLADGRASSEALVRVIREHSAQAFMLDMTNMAQAAGTVISAVLFGAVAASGVLPFARDAYQRTIRAGGKGAEASVRGFDAAFDALTALRNERAAVASAVASALSATTPALSAPSVAASSPSMSVPTSILTSLSPSPSQFTDADESPLRGFPASVREIASLGYARVLEYQNANYAALYVDRLQRVLAAERAGDPSGANAFETTRETARHLAVWMAFDDIVRVAELKCRASRFARVRGEVRVNDDELLRVHDHFKPGIAEFAAMLPPPMAARLTRWERRRTARGKSAIALPIKLASHTVIGLLALRGLAALKRLRPRGSRYQAEQSMIDRWLAVVESAAREDTALGRELAHCGRLIKGYGATNERGKESLLHVIEHLASPTGEASSLSTPAARASAIAAARRAALADDAGKALDLTLARFGAPPRPVKEQPINWVRKRPGGRAGDSANTARTESDIAA